MNLMRNVFGGGGSAGGGGLFGNIASLVQKFQQFVTNPLGFLLGMNFNIPQSLGNNPEGMVQHLRSSGQMTPDQFDQLSQMADTFQQFLQKRP